VKKFIDNGIFCIDWNQAQIQDYQNRTSSFKAIISRWITKNEMKLFDISENIYHKYRTDFWEIIEEYNLFKDWNDSFFMQLCSKFSLFHFLPFRKIVNHFCSPIIERLKTDKEALDFILRVYVYLDSRQPQILLPPNLTMDTIEQIMIRFLETEDTNFHVLHGIVSFPAEKGRNISKKVKRAAKRKIQSVNEKIFNKENVQISGYKLEVSFSPDIEEKFGYRVHQEESELQISYNSTWILKNTDVPTLLNNFIYLFEFSDPWQMRIPLYNNKRKVSFIDLISGSGLRNGFNPSSEFTITLDLIMLKMKGYYHFLKETVGTTIETLIDNFFSEFLPREFSIEGFGICMPTTNTTYLEKCKVIAPEIEKMMRLYHFYVNEGTIDQNLFEFDTNPIPIGLISSLISNKYVYPAEDLFETASYYLCSDQCMLNYLGEKDKSYNSFIELLSHEKVTVADYHEMYHGALDWLVSSGFININQHKHISINNTSFIILDLYKNGYISFWHMDIKSQLLIQELDKNGFVKIAQEQVLFSKIECDFFNYVLNNSCFIDSKAIRNKYVHGIMDNSMPNSVEHQDNYMLFLILSVMLIIKINDELCIVSSPRYSKHLGLPDTG